ncbi:MAG: hypothetical protein GY863_06210 [bacterium]|nr:hypothetical protein [bacterium]
MNRNYRRGRIKGQGIGCGAIQVLIKNNGGKVYLESLYSKIQSADGIADYFFRQFNLYCCANTVRNIMKQYDLKLNSSGGDRRSGGAVKFRTERLEGLSRVIDKPFRAPDVYSSQENIRRQVCCL